MSQDFGEEVWIPTGAFAAELDSSLVLCGADEIDCEVSDDGHISSAVASPQTGLILTEGDVEDPVQTVLDGPVTANGLGCLRG